MSLSDEAEFWWKGPLPKDKKPRTAEQIARKEYLQKQAIRIRKLIKQAHPEWTKTTIQRMAQKAGGYEKLLKELTDKL